MGDRHTITEARLREMAGGIARLEGDLRYLHLAAHLEPRKVLTDNQMRKYDELRGYSRSPVPARP